jgi:predicted amidohydrolase
MVQLTISLGQIDVKVGKPEKNLARVKEWTEEAARRGSDLVIFPELWDTGYALDRAHELGSTIETGRFEIMRELAQEHKIHIGGSLLEYRDGRAYNTFCWFMPDGEIAGVYRKLHLFRLMDEDRYLEPGAAPLTLDMPWGKTSLAICYDLRFPELFRGYALGGATLFVIPAQWPRRRIVHWSTLLRARAIENQMVVAACNRVGWDSEDAPFGGQSVVLDAWGQPLAEAGESETLLTVMVDMESVPKARNMIPVFQDRRPDVYLDDRPVRV